MHDKLYEFLGGMLHSIKEQIKDDGMNYVLAVYGRNPDHDLRYYLYEEYYG